jgi:sensor histidine kinase regulating citrate/malate metabolism
MATSLYAATGFLVLLALSALFLQRLVARQVKELHASLLRTDQVLASTDALRSEVAAARQAGDRVADSVTGIAEL